MAEALADPTRLPLIVAVNPFVNESAAFADYIVPDTVLYETWGWAAPWAGVPTRTTTARWPAVDPPLATGPDGDPFGMESFLIACALALSLPGFVPGAIGDTQGGTHPLLRAADGFLRGGANVAFAGSAVPARLRPRRDIPIRKPLSTCGRSSRAGLALGQTLSSGRGAPQPAAKEAQVRDMTVKRRPIGTPPRTNFPLQDQCLRHHKTGVPVRSLRTGRRYRSKQRRELPSD